MAKYKYLVITNAVAGKEAEFNDWYTQQHLSDVLKVPGFEAAQRFEVTGQSALPGKYVAIYEMETDNPEATLQDLHSRSNSPEMTLSDSLDIATTTVALLSPITDTVTS